MRTGKIARLPMAVREELNRRIQNSELGKPILDWLNALPETREVLAAQFGGKSINSQNLCVWRRGGWREWQARQVALDKVDEIASDGEEMQQLAGGPVADRLASWLAARYYVAMNTAMESNGNADDLELLHGFCADMAELRRADHSAVRLKLKQERLQDSAANQSSCSTRLSDRTAAGLPQ
jgi:hypothetical protein